jgi:hypothetical protein
MAETMCTRVSKNWIGYCIGILPKSRITDFIRVIRIDELRDLILSFLPTYLDKSIYQQMYNNCIQTIPEIVLEKFKFKLVNELLDGYRKFNGVDIVVEIVNICISSKVCGYQREYEDNFFDVLFGYTIESIYYPDAPYLYIIAGCTTTENEDWTNYDIIFDQVKYSSSYEDRMCFNRVGSSKTKKASEYNKLILTYNNSDWCRRCCSEYDY